VHTETVLLLEKYQTLIDVSITSSSSISEPKTIFLDTQTAVKTVVQTKTPILPHWLHQQQDLGHFFQRRCPKNLIRELVITYNYSKNYRAIYEWK
jgi:hypothetical protein